MKKIFLFALAFLLFHSANSQDWGFSVSAENSCVLLVEDLNFNFIKFSFSSDELRWLTRSNVNSGLLTGLNLWDDSRSITWNSLEPDPVIRNANVLSILAFIKLNRFECKQ